MLDLCIVLQRNEMSFVFNLCRVAREEMPLVFDYVIVLQRNEMSQDVRFVLCRNGRNAVWC